MDERGRWGGASGRELAGQVRRVGRAASRSGSAGAAGRELVGELRRLGEVEAPARLLPAVLAAVGVGDAYARVDAAIGPVYVAYSDRGVSFVSRAADEREFERRFRARFDRPVYRLEGLPARLERAVRRRLAGERADVRFDLRGLSPFTSAVLSKAREIPRGEVRPYAWVAAEIGHPGAVRAVGSALGNNPVPLLIPCHRVVRSDGRIGDYALGAEAKRAVLAAEGVAADELEDLAHAGVRYFGSDTTRIYCHPTCRHARRVTDRHRVTFRSAGEAVAAGYRPCKVCRPVRAA